MLSGENLWYLNPNTVGKERLNVRGLPAGRNLRFSAHDILLKNRIHSGLPTVARGPEIFNHLAAVANGNEMLLFAAFRLPRSVRIGTIDLSDLPSAARHPDRTEPRP